MDRIIELILSSQSCQEIKKTIRAFREKLKNILFIYKLIEICNFELKTSFQLFYRSHTEIDPEKNLILGQDRNLSLYYQKLLKLLVHIPWECSQFIQDKDYINWQLLQGYRLVNAMLASYDDSIFPLKLSLQKIKMELKQRSHIKSLFQSMESNPSSRYLVCSGHGGWHPEDGMITLKLAEDRVVFYCSPNSSLTYIPQQNHE